MKGILLIALGHNNYYRMAVNLAASIKVNNPGLPVALVNDGSVSIEGKLFDLSIIHHCKKEDIIKTKTLVYELSPFDETIFLDVDLILLKGRKLSPLFQQLKDCSWTMANTGIAGASIWADIDLIKSKYAGSMWNYHSEFIYFKKCDAARQYFDKVKEVYENEDVEAIKAIKFSNGRMADELAFQLASMQLNAYPHKENFLPTFWFHREKQHLRLYPFQLPPKYVAYSIGGNYVPSTIATNYNNLASIYAKKLGLQSFYKAQHKRAFLPERIKV